LGFTYATLDTTPFFEPLLGMLQSDIRIVIGEDDAIHVARDGHEQSIVCELFDGALEYFPDLNIRDPEKFLFQDRSAHRKLKDAIKRMVPGDPGTMRSTNFPRSRRRG
jgi:hypothetical protein